MAAGRQLGGLGHPHLAGLLGLAGRYSDDVSSDGGPVCLVSEYLDYGDLHQFLQNQAAAGAVWLPNISPDFRSVLRMRIVQSRISVARSGCQIIVRAWTSGLLSVFQCMRSHCLIAHYPPGLLCLAHAQCRHGS